MEYEFPINWPKIIFLAICCFISAYSLFIRIFWKHKHTWIPRLPAKKQWPSFVISIGQFFAFVILVWLTWSWHSSSTKKEDSDFHKMGEFISGMESKLTSTEKRLKKIHFPKHDEIMKTELPVKLFEIEARAKILKKIDIEEFDKFGQWTKNKVCANSEMKRMKTLHDEEIGIVKGLMSTNETRFETPRKTWFEKTNKIKDDKSKLDAEKTKFDGHVERTRMFIERILFVWKNAESFFHAGLLFASEYENHKLIWLYLISGIGAMYFGFWSPVCTMLFTKYQLDGYWVKLMRRLFYLNAISAIILSGYEIHSTYTYKCSPIMLNSELDDFSIPSYNTRSMFKVKDVFMKCASDGRTLFSATNDISKAQKSNFTVGLEMRLGDDATEIFEEIKAIDIDVLKPRKMLIQIGETLKNVSESCSNSTLPLQPVLGIVESMESYHFISESSGSIEKMKKDSFGEPMRRMHQYINNPVDHFNDIVRGTDINCSQFHDAYMHGYKWSCTAVNQVVIDHLKMAVIGCSAMLAVMHMFYLRRADNTQFWDDPRVRWAHQFMTDNVDDEQYREYLTINNENPPDTTYEHFAKKKNWKRNRFGDLGLIDQTRVVLTNHVTDYIHASWIPIPGTNRRYIATQAPLENTFKEFWHMVVQENVKIIVMLTAFIEMDKRICDRYFPFYVGDTIIYDHFEVKCLDRVPAPKSTGLWLTDKRTFKLIDLKNPDAPPRFISHIFFKRWFTEVVPKGLERVVDLQRYVESLVEDDSPIVVHCSDGIVRTGTYICLDYAHALIVQGRFESMVQVVNELAQLRWV